MSEQAKNGKDKAVNPGEQASKIVDMLADALPDESPEDKLKSLTETVQLQISEAQKRADALNPANAAKATSGRSARRHRRLPGSQ